MRLPEETSTKQRIEKQETCAKTMRKTKTNMLKTVENDSKDMKVKVNVVNGNGGGHSDGVCGEYQLYVHEHSGKNR